MYKFSQSGLKDLEDDINCPFRWKAVHIDRTETYELGDAADYGKFFEYLCLGTNAGVTELKKLKSGAKSVLEKRITAQAKLFKEMFTKNTDRYIGEEVVSANMFIETDKEKGILDFMSSNDDDRLRFWDLKLVANLDRGYYMYGNHDAADYTQQIFYANLLDKNGFKDYKMSLIIFEHSGDMRVKIIDLDISRDTKDIISVRVESATEVISMYKEKGWVTFPSIDECNKCSIKCQDRIEERSEDTEKEEEQPSVQQQEVSLVCLTL